MAYGYILRKYRLPVPGMTRYDAMKSWRAIVEKKLDEDFLIDEFAVDDAKKVGWFGTLKKQLFG